MHSPYHWQLLPNGMKLATASLLHTECASMAIYIPAGSRHDPFGLAGLAHFMEHMAFKGTSKRTAAQLSLELERFGAQANACTTQDHTVYDARGDASSLALLADILSDMVWRSSLPPREIALERDVIHEEITMDEESPSDHIGDLISRALWAPDPLGEPITGTHASLDSINRSHLFEFCQTHHFRADIVIAAAGPFSPAEFAQHIIPYLPEKSVAPPATNWLFKKRQNSAPIVVHRETEQLQLALAYHTPGRRHSHRYALRLLSIILGEATSSRLFQKIREQRGLCYFISSDVALFDDTGSLEISLGLDPESRGEALRLIESEIEDLRSKGPTEEELLRAQKIANTGNKLALESTSAHMAWAAESLLFEGEITTPEEYRKRICAVTVEQMREIAQEIFSSSNRAIAEIRSL